MNLLTNGSDVYQVVPLDLTPNMKLFLERLKWIEEIRKEILSKAGISEDENGVDCLPQKNLL